MPLRDWGLGLEELTDFYHRYGLRFTDEGINKETQTWIMTRGFIDRVAPYHSKKKIPKFRGLVPREIDLVGVRINNDCKVKEVRLIQCKEKISGSMVDQIMEQFEYTPYLYTITRVAGQKRILTKCVSFVEITSPSRKKFEEYGVKLLSFKEMVDKMLQHFKVQEKLNRKGLMREPILWMLQSLKDEGFMKTYDKKEKSQN